MVAIILLASLSQVQCPKWLPGTNLVLPAGVELAPAQELQNRLRCYCEVVVPEERNCLQRYSKEECVSRTQAWIRENFPNFLIAPNLPQRGRRALRMMSVEP